MLSKDESIDLLSKSEIAEEYGITYSGNYRKISEVLGQQPSVVGEAKYSLEGVLEESRMYDVSRIEDNITSSKKYIEEKEKSLITKIINAKNISYLKRLILEVEKKKQLILNSKPEIISIEDKVYEVPKDRLHTGDDVFIIDFFQKPLAPVFRVLKVISTDISVKGNIVSLSYVVGNDNSKDCIITNNKNTGKLELNYSDCYIMKDREDALLFIKSYIKKHCEFMKIAEQELIKQVENSRI